MRTISILGILILLALALPAPPAHAGGVVTVCDEAHLLAALAGAGMVTFRCSGTITLTNTITISVDTTVDGSGQAVTISGNNAVRVFTVNERVTLNLNGLTIANGNAYHGGGIYNNIGYVTVSNCSFSGNSIHGGGGGIYNWFGTLTVSNSTFSGNSASFGGGIVSNGTLAVSNSTFSGNNANNGGGGGIYNNGPASMTNSTFSGNSATGPYGFGGGIENDNYGTLVASNSTFSSNSARSGGGICKYGGTLTVINSTFSDNGATSDGGAIYSRATYNNGPLTVINSTFSGNRASGDAGAVAGGSTDYGTITLKNTIITNSPSGNNCSDAITDGGGNLNYPDTTCPGINADPMLGPLQNSGGPTQTMALGWGSAALDAGGDAICAAPPVNNLDQRGVTRPLGLHCDIGAVEQEPYPPLPSRMWLPVVSAQ